MNKSDCAKWIAMYKLHADYNANDARLVEMWAIAFDDLPAAVMEPVYKWWIKHKKWFPKPSEIFDVAHELVYGIPSPEEARVQVERSLKENYPGQPLKYEPDPLVIEALRTVGGTHVFRNAQSGRETESLWQRFAFVYAELRAERLEAIDYAGEYAQLASGDRQHIRSIDSTNRRAS
jgi:hypothetical protein